MRKRDKLRVKRKRYYRITAVIIISFLIFELISNFTYILYMRLTQENISRLEDVDMHVLLDDMDIKISSGVTNETAINQCSILLIGERSEKGNQYIIQELEYTKEKYCVQTDFTGVAGLNNISTVILTKNIYTAEEEAQITALISQGVNLVFTKLPDSTELNSDWGKTTLGIVRTNGEVTYKGLRFISNFFIGDMLELRNYKVKFQDVDLEQGCKVYAYSLMDYYSKGYEGEIPEEEIGVNENMPPLIWRNIIDNSEIYVIAGDFMGKSVATGVINGVLSKMQDVYLYPVVGGKSIYFIGVPYTENENSEIMQELYSRDSLGVQQDLVFPGLVHLVSKYNLFPCYYTEDLNELINNKSDKDISYYMKELTKQTATLGYINNVGDYLTFRENIDVSSLSSDEIYNSAFTITNKWDNIFTFYNENDNLIHLPIIEDSINLSESDILISNAVSSAYGYMSNSVDLRSIVYPQDSNDSWVKIQKDLGALLSYQNERFGYLDNLNNEDTVKRLLIYNLIDPEIKYSDNKIKVTIDNFYGEAHFILRTRNDIVEVVGGSYNKIGEEAYMIYQQEETMTIIYKEGF